MNPTRSAPVLAAMVATIMLSTTACWGGDEKGAEQAKEAPNPCSLLKAAEVEAALGVKVAKPEPVEPGGTPPIPIVGMTFCRYRGITSLRPPSAASAESGEGRPNLVIHFGVTSSLARESYDKATRERPFSPVGDLGVEAVWDGSRLVALKGDRIFSIIMFSPVPTPDDEERMKRLTAKALGRL